LLIGYVSDERFAALADVIIEVERQGGEPIVARSTASGAIYADLESGEYRVNLCKAGYGSKHVDIKVDPAVPVQFRLLPDCMLGYAWPKWVKSGEAGDFKVHAVEGYRISLWRYGLNKEEVKFIGWIDEHSPRATMQILPDDDFSQTGVGWNSSGYPANFAGHRIEAPERSGLYFFHAETESGDFFSFPWVVAPKAPAANIAVLASTNTWNAYNNFGGRSNYINSTGLPSRPAVNSRQDISRYTGEIGSVWQYGNDDYQPLSFERPEIYNHIPRQRGLYDPIRGRQAGHLAEAEWKLLGWLEREGFAYDFYSDFQLHSGDLDLSSYKILIISTHPEYWSRKQYARVRSWVMNDGGKLIYLGGNGIDCEIVYNDDGSTMRCLSHYPHDVPGTPFRDLERNVMIECRFHLTTGESPASLLGVVFSDPGIGTGAPYKVTKATHWIFENTGLRDEDIFGKTSLHERSPGGASGHETDKRSPSTPRNAEFVATGMNLNDGGAEIAIINYPGGGQVFSAGSITWTSSILVDAQISQITRNVIRQFMA